MSTQSNVEFDVDSIIQRLSEVPKYGRPKQVNLEQHEIQELCFQSKEIFRSQPMLLELEAPLTIAGTFCVVVIFSKGAIYGHYHGLLRLFEAGGFPPETNYLFLGNYVDRGTQGIETICLLLAYKIKYPENFFLLRGNHECAYQNRMYGFYDECI